MTKQTRRAWVIRWDWSGPHAARDRRFVMALPSTQASRNVAKTLELLYAASEYEPSEILDYMVGRRANPYPARYATRVDVHTGSYVQSVESPQVIVCGHNPHLEARLAIVTTDADGTVTWVDDGLITDIGDPSSTSI